MVVVHLRHLRFFGDHLGGGLGVGVVAPPRRWELGAVTERYSLTN